MLFITLLMICEGKTRENNVFLKTQCTRARARTYSGVINAVLGQNTPFLFSFRQRSREQGIVYEYDPREFFFLWWLKWLKYNFLIRWRLLSITTEFVQVNPPVQFHSVLKIMDTNRRMSSKENVRPKLLLSSLLPGFSYFISFGYRVCFYARLLPCCVCACVVLFHGNLRCSPRLPLLLKDIFVCPTR